MTPDQSFITPHNLGAAINEGFGFVAQTYTAGMTGKLAGIFIAVQSQSNHPLHVAIHGVRDGVPDSTVLGQATMPSGSSLPWPVPIIFSEEVEQVAGTQYAIVVHYPDALPSGAGRGQGTWTGAIGNPYAGGMMCMSVDGNSWRVEEDHDVHFQTFIKSE